MAPYRYYLDHKGTNRGPYATKVHCSFIAGLHTRGRRGLCTLHADARAVAAQWNARWLDNRLEEGHEAVGTIYTRKA